MTKKDEKKVTWKKKMSNADYLNMLAYVQDKEMPVLDDIEPTWLGTIEEHSFRTTKEEKDKIENFFKKFIGGVSLEAVIAAAPKITTKPKANTNALPTAPIYPTTAPAAPTQTIAPTTTPPATQNAPNDKPTPLTEAELMARANEPKIPFKVLTDEERQAWADSDDWTPKLSIDDDDTASYKLDLSVEEYPFIINPNEEICLANVDIDMALDMIIKCKIDWRELIGVVQLTKEGKKLLDYNSEQLGLANNRYFKQHPNLIMIAVTAGKLAKQYKELLEDEPESAEKTFERYQNYLKTKNKPHHQDFNAATRFDEFVKVADDNIVFANRYDDDGDDDYLALTYDNFDTLFLDLLLFSDKFKIDLSKSFTAFGKTTTLNKFCKSLYKKYPNGLDGKSFFKSRLEAFNAGVYNL